MYSRNQQLHYLISVVLQDALVSSCEFSEIKTRPKNPGFVFLMDFTLTLLKQRLMADKTAVELFEELKQHYIVSSAYRVGFSKEVSPGVLSVIKHLKGDLAPEDIVPISTTLTVVLKHKDKPSHPIIDTYHQSSAIFMEVFDNTGFEDWAKSKLTNV